jgi:hypothetical protein
LIVSYNNHDPNASMARSRFEQVKSEREQWMERHDQRYERMMQILKESTALVTAMLNETLPKIRLSSPTTPQVTHAQSTTFIVQTLDETKTSTQTQTHPKSAIPALPNPKEIPSQKDAPLENPEQAVKSTKSAHLPCRASPSEPTPTKRTHKVESQTQSQSPNLLAHSILSRPKIHTHTTPDPILEPPPTPCRDPYKTGHSRHNPPLRLQPLQPKSPAESVRSMHRPAHPTPRHTAIHKLIPIRQTTITLEFLSRPQPESPPPPPNDPKPSTTQEQTKESRPTVVQPDPPPTRCRNHYRADPAPLPCVAVISPLPDGCDAGHRTITPSLHSVSTNPKLSSPAADQHLYCNVAQNPDEVHRSSYVVWFTGKGKSRILLCLVPKPKTRGLALAREEKRTEFPYRWFRKKKKKKDQRRTEGRSHGQREKVGQKKKKKKAKVFILYCFLCSQSCRFHIHNSKNKRQNF